MSIAREHFIPVPRATLIDALIEAGLPEPANAAKPADAGFRDFARVLTALFHYEYHTQLEHLKALYAPINPDNLDAIDDRAPGTTSSADTVTDPTAAMDELVAALDTLITAGNFKDITDSDLRESLAEESLFQVRLQVDFDDFERVLFFRRGSERRRETVKRWFGLRKKEIEFTNYDRVLVFVQIKPQAHFDQTGQKNLAFRPGAVVLKLFQNVPKGDLEMLFPNTQVRMRTLDKLLIGIPAAVSGIVMLTTKLGATLLLTGGLAAFFLGLRNEPVTLDQGALLALATGLFTLGAYLWKQYSTFKNRKILFMKRLTESLYFKNLDNNAGVLFSLVDAAEEEECKEVLLAYHTLLTAGPMTAPQIDAHVEQWLLERFGIDLDFEISDACNKLERLGLVEMLPADPHAHIRQREVEGQAEGEANGEVDGADAPTAALPRYRALSVTAASVRLDFLWDSMIRFGQLDG